MVFSTRRAHTYTHTLSLSLSRSLSLLNTSSLIENKPHLAWFYVQTPLLVSSALVKSLHLSKIKQKNYPIASIHACVTKNDAHRRNTIRLQKEQSREQNWKYSPTPCIANAFVSSKQRNQQKETGKLYKKIPASIPFSHTMTHRHKTQCPKNRRDRHCIILGNQTYPIQQKELENSSLPWFWGWESAVRSILIFFYSCQATKNIPLIHVWTSVTFWWGWRKGLNSHAILRQSQNI